MSTDIKGFEFKDYYYQSESYDWSAIGVWKNDKGYYLGTDSGCSCNSPFEDYRFDNDLTGPLTPEQAVEEIISNTKSDYFWDEERDLPELNEFIGNVFEGDVKQVEETVTVKVWRPCGQ